MSRKRKHQPGAELAQRSMETGQSLRDGEFLSHVESDGEGRLVRITDGEGAIRYTLASFPASDSRSRLVPGWVPFVPDVEFVITEWEGRRLLVFNVSSGIPGDIRATVKRLPEILEGHGIKEPGSFNRPDGSVDREAVATYVQAVQAKLPAGVMSQLKELWSGDVGGTEQLDRVWEALRSWFRDRGWEVEDREVKAPGPSGRACRFTKETEHYDATASSMMGIQQVMVFA